ncbi:MAG: hypothetical protein ACOYBY_03765 [Dermatophilaceae bacterium]
MSFLSVPDIPSVQAHLHTRYDLARPGHGARAESSLRVIARSLRRTRRAEEGTYLTP